MDDSKDSTRGRVSRRGLLKGLGMGAAGTAVAAPALKKTPPTTRVDSGPIPPVRSAKGRVPVTLKVNGGTQKVTVEPRTTLLDVLRDQLDLTGAKLVCNHGSCGACTVHINGKPRYSCMTLALDADGQQITTIEGLTPKTGLTPLQEEFVSHDATMCGFCTPGFIMSLTTFLQENPNPTLEQVKRACQGNTCRCGTYPKIFEATLAAARRTRREA
ncbi:MAG: (2Fe-2S)-binding protein [Armatimonadetes bacterium]|nr:(2Fe-2S)-binding protein [Armatimonadota bacterium]